MKTLVAYFSKSGQTAKVAKDIAVILDADIFEIKTEKEYPRSYIKTLAVSRKEFNTGERPALTGDVDNFDAYDRVMIGFPVWYGTCPMAVVSFLEKHDWAGKDIYPFCTSTSTSIDKSEKDIAEYAGTTVHKGLRLKSVKALKKEDILKWAL